MTSNSLSALNPVDRDTVILAYKLSDFLESEHAFSRQFSQELRAAIVQVKSKNFRPPQITRGISSAREDRARVRSQSLESNTWPSDWAVDKSALRASLKIFERGTQAFRRLQDPPSTGVTPHTSPVTSPLQKSIEDSPPFEPEAESLSEDPKTLEKGKGRLVTTSTLSSPEPESPSRRQKSTPSYSPVSEIQKETGSQAPYSITEVVKTFAPGKATFHMAGRDAFRAFSGPSSGFPNTGLGSGFSRNPGSNGDNFQAGPSAQGNPNPSPDQGHAQAQQQGPTQTTPQAVPPPDGVDPAMWNTMLRAMQATLANFQPTSGPAGPAGPPGLPGAPGPSGQNTSSGPGSGGFRASDLGFFHPDLEESYGTGDIVFSSKENIYREVYSFCRRVEDYAVIKGEDVVRTNLSTCFRGAALSWWLNTLSQDEKDAMMQLQTGLRRTLTRLQDRFKISMSSALDQLTRQVYTLSDAGSRRDPASYVQSVSKYAIQAGISDEHAQATWAWNHLDVELQASIPPPTSQTTLRQFTEELDNRKELWHRLQQQKEMLQKDTRKEIRDREKDRDRERERDRDRGERSGKDRSTARDRQGGYQDTQQRQSFPSRPFIPGARAFEARTYQPGPLYPNYGYQQQPNFPMYPFYPQQAYAPYRQMQGGQTTYNQPTAPQTQPQAPPQAPAANLPPPRNGLPAPKQPLMITAGNVQPNQSNYPPRQNYGNRGGRPYYPPRQYGTNQGYGNPGYGNQGFAGMPVPQPPQEAYYNDFPEEFLAEGYHSDFDPSFSHDASAYHAGSDDHFHDAQEDKVSEDEKPDSKDEVDVGFVSISYHATAGKMGEKTVCRKCEKEFPSNNKLHSHLKEKACRRKTIPKETKNPNDQEPVTTDDLKVSLLTETPDSGDLELIESKAPPSPSNGMAFRSWHYLTALFSLSRNGVPESGCLDTGCGMSMGDRSFLRRLIPSFTTKKHDNPITLRGIGSNRHSTVEWTTVSFFLKGETQAGKPVMIKFTRDIHVVDNLKANILIGMDILGPEGVVIDLPHQRVTFTNCNGVSVPVQATARDNVRIRRVVRTGKRHIIPAKSTGTVAVSLRGKGLLPDRDFLFEPEMNGVYAHFVDSTFDFVSVRNDTASPLVMPRHHRIGSVIEYEAEESYPIDVESHSLAAKASPDKEPRIAELTTLLTPKSAVSKTTVDPCLETKLPNGITIYGKPEHVEIMRRISEENPRVWEDTGDTIDLPESEWLQVPITTDWQSSSAKLGNKVYPLTPEARAVVDEKFDRCTLKGK